MEKEEKKKKDEKKQKKHKPGRRAKVHKLTRILLDRVRQHLQPRRSEAMHAVTHMLPFTDFKLQETVKGLSSTASKAALVCESSRFPGDKFNSSFVVRGVQSHTSSDSSHALLLSQLS